MGWWTVFEGLCYCNDIGEIRHRSDQSVHEEMPHTSLVIKEMQIKTTMRPCFPHTKMAIIKETDMNC